MRTGIGIVVGIFGGLGIFLLGIQLMGEGLQKAAGERMRRLLELFTSKPITAVLTGAGVTALLQSSTTTTVMIVGFVNSGLMSLSQAVGTMMGANIGTTITAQIVSFDIYVLALPAIGLGALFYNFSKRRSRYAGLGVLGFGLLLLGLSTMSGAIRPVAEYEPFVRLLVSLGRWPILGIIAGMLFTVLVQSSSAITGLVIAFSWQGIITLPAGLALIVGANLGTCITVILASIGASLVAKRAALSHVLFNLFGVILFVIFRKPFTSLVALTGHTISRQIANAHTLFNIGTTLILFPLLPYFVKVVTSLVPGEDVVIELKPKYLDDRMIHTPASLISAQREAVRMGELALVMIEHGTEVFAQGEAQLMNEIRQREEVVNVLEKAITAYLARANQYPMGEGQARFLTNLMHIVNDIERIGDHAVNIAELGLARIDGGLKLSQAAAEDLQDMVKVVSRIYRDSLTALGKQDVELAKRLISDDDLVDDLEKKYRSNHIERLNEGLCCPEIGVLFLDVVSNLERIGDHANNIAEAVADIAFNH